MEQFVPGNLCLFLHPEHKFDFPPAFFKQKLDTQLIDGKNLEKNEEKIMKFEKYLIFIINKNVWL